VPIAEINQVSNFEEPRVYLEKFLYQEVDEDISPAAAQSLNEELARISFKSIPIDRRAFVADYLATALNMNSVRQEISPALNLLLSELQARGQV
jgi:hypothetical protein